MAFEIRLEEDEHLIADLAFAVPRKVPELRIAISDRAIFLPRKKFFAVKDPNYAERVPLNRVLEARIKKLNPLFSWLLALVMVAAGTATTVVMALPLLRGEGGHLSGYPPALAIVGLVVPFVARGRCGLVISIVDENFFWKPKLHVDKESRLRADELFTEIYAALRQAGVNVVDEREHAASTVPRAGGASHQMAMPGDVSGGDGVVRPCCRCGQPLRISRWDDWNGFLFRCPHCGGVHGKPWKPPVILFASLLLNAFSFFFTLRWKQALPLFLLFAVLGGLFNLGLDHGQFSQTIELVLASIFLLSPLGVNAALLLRHQIAIES